VVRFEGGAGHGETKKVRGGVIYPGEGPQPQNFGVAKTQFFDRTSMLQKMNIEKTFTPPHLNHPQKRI